MAPAVRTGRAWRGDRLARLLTAALALITAAPALAGAELKDTECWFDVGAGRRTHCAWLTPSRQDAAGAIRLPVVILRRQSERASRRAVIYLTGGPGAGSDLDTAGLRAARMWRAQLGLRQDLVLYDQRGTGRAQPSLHCDGNDAHLRSVLAGPGDYGQRMAKAAKFLLACARLVSPEDRAAGLYGTVTAAADLRDLMATLTRVHGYRSFALFGESYGTRLAIEAVRGADVPVDRLVLDSVYPPGSGGTLAILPEDFEHLLASIDARCRTLAGCASHEGGIRAALRRALDRLGAAPLQVVARDLRAHDRSLEMRIERQDLLDVLVSALYGEDRIAEFPGLLDRLARTGPDPDWQALFDAAATLWMDATFSPLAHHLIGCRDNPPLDPAKLDKQLAAWPQFADVMRPAPWQYALCDWMGVPAQPLDTDWEIRIPTLLLSRRIDPATPLHHLEAVRHRFERAELIVVPGAGHGVIGVDAEITRRAGRFLDGDPDPIDPQ
ncbi:MAG: alpha/beta fold hydrolase [Xanthomonadales bacterium]|nr:alpha/beta fold hydrolase [Xanthomonadales bacterium]